MEIRIKDRVVSEFQYENRQDITEVIFEDGVEIIEAGAFYHCRYLKSVTFAPSVKLVREGAFAGCVSLESLQYEKNTRFEEFAFNECNKLKYLLSNGVSARVFPFPVTNDFAIAIKQPDLSTSEYTIYAGRMANPKYFPNGPVDTNDHILFFAESAKDPNCVWFSGDVGIAIVGMKYKASKQSFSQFFHIDLTDEIEIDYNVFSILIGCCGVGRTLWKILSNRRETVPVAEVRHQLEEYQVLFDDILQRFNTACKKQHEVFNYLDINILPSGAEFKQKFHMFIFGD